MKYEEKQHTRKTGLSKEQYEFVSDAVHTITSIITDYYPLTYIRTTRNNYAVRVRALTMKIFLEIYGDKMEKLPSLVEWGRLLRPENPLDHASIAHYKKREYFLGNKTELFYKSWRRILRRVKFALIDNKQQKVEYYLKHVGEIEEEMDDLKKELVRVTDVLGLSVINFIDQIPKHKRGSFNVKLRELLAEFNFKEDYNY